MEPGLDCGAVSSVITPGIGPCHGRGELRSCCCLQRKSKGAEEGAEEEQSLKPL